MKVLGICRARLQPCLIFANLKGLPYIAYFVGQGFILAYFVAVAFMRLRNLRGAINRVVTNLMYSA